MLTESCIKNKSFLCASDTWTVLIFEWVERFDYICRWISCYKIDFRVLGHVWQALVCSAATSIIQLPICCYYFIIYIYIYISRFKTSGDAFRLPYSIAFDCSIRPYLDLVQPSLFISHLFRFFWDGLVFFLPSCFQLIMIFGIRVRSILSTWQYRMICFRVVSSNIVSCAFIFSLIYSFVLLSSLEIIADRLNAPISVALILLLSSSYKLQVSAP